MKEIIVNLVNEFIYTYKECTNSQTKWGDPIIGFAEANDPGFIQLKNIVNENHKLPNEILSNAKTVISYFIPFNQEVVSSNTNGKIASKEWAVAYIETNNLITGLNKTLAECLKKEKFNSTKIPATHNFDKTKLISYWSHKHVAYIAGLGRFGLHKMIITKKGCCGRLGSLITSAKVEATKRQDIEYCLFFHDKSCKKCIDKCVYGILNLDSFDRHKCHNVCLENNQIYSHLGLSDVCGKCACGVPCSLKNPVG
ncbi:MAG: epoxyqueuosine reductase [Candidatus Odinarchaeota archaeon]